jgi:AcrR family transcriptional regulator
MKRIRTASRAAPMQSSARPRRERVLGAAFSAFTERGFSGASTLDIATRAKVSKRELYALFENKHAMLAACIADRAQRMRLPLDLPAPRGRDALVATLNAFGIAFLSGVCDPKVLAVYRLAIAESDSSPEIARLLEKTGREPNRAALVALFTSAKANGLFGAVEPATIAARFFALVWGDLLIRLLLGVTNPPEPAEIERRVRAATEVLMALYPAPTRGTQPR